VNDVGMMRRWCRVLLLLAIVLAPAACRTADPLMDSRIESEVKARLVGEKRANLTRLGVMSSEGIVYLSGTVASADEKQRAEAVAGDVKGVRRVVNGVEIAPPRQ
jgi:osmotically-inducible protein OsmY